MTSTLGREAQSHRPGPATSNQECPPHPAGTCVTYIFPYHALEGVRLETESLV